MSARQPLLTLSPSPQNFHSPQCLRIRSVTETTPKLPRRERLASFSRLLNSENIRELFKEKPCENRFQRKLFSGEEHSQQSDVAIRITQSSPEGSILNESPKEWCANVNSLTPCSLARNSPGLMTPNRLQVTPLRSPLYTPNRKGMFLGRGAFGNVTLCQYKGKEYALKVVHQSITLIGEKNLLEINHPHLVKVFNITTVMDNVLICMEFAGHCNLQNVLDTKSEIDFPRRLSFCIQIAMGLNHCHQRNIVHGDVKPANVIISPYGICKLGDFGHSINLKSNDLTLMTEDKVGTAAYAAPEILCGKKSSTLSDIYSFGVLMWQVYTREVPFAGEHPHIVIYKVVNYAARPKFKSSNSAAREAYANAAQVCWSEDPAKRYAMIEVLSNLKAIKCMVKHCKSDA